MLMLVNVGDVVLFGLVIDCVSMLILFVVVFFGLLVMIYFMGYLMDKNCEYLYNGMNCYYVFLLVFIGDGGIGIFFDVVWLVVVF